MNTVMYNSQAVEGTPERPGRARYVWDMLSIDPLVEEYSESGHPLFYLTQKVAGSWSHSEQLEDYQVQYVPRSPALPPVYRLQLAYLDDDGTIQNELRDAKDTPRR